MKPLKIASVIGTGSKIIKAASISLAIKNFGIRANV